MSQKQLESLQNSNWSFSRVNFQCSGDNSVELIAEFRWAAQIQTNQLSGIYLDFRMKLKLEQIKYAIEHLESKKSASHLCSAIANDLDELDSEPKRSILFWKRTFKRTIKRLAAKHVLFDHISRYYVSIEWSSRTLKPIQVQVLNGQIKVCWQNT